MLQSSVSDEVDVVVHPSLDEAFSMTVLESMALAKPVIAGRDTPGIRQALRGGDAGVLTDVRDSQFDRSIHAHTDNRPFLSSAHSTARISACCVYVPQGFDRSAVRGSL